MSKKNNNFIKPKNDKWEVVFYKNKKGNIPVKEWIENLNKKTKTKIYRNIQLLEEMGINLKEPFVKHLKSKLYELRIKDEKGIYRIIYFSYTNRQFVLLHGFVKKTQKTPNNEIIIAETRMKEVLNNE